MRCLLNGNTDATQNGRWLRWGYKLLGPLVLSGVWSVRRFTRWRRTACRTSAIRYWGYLVVLTDRRERWGDVVLHSTMDDNRPSRTRSLNMPRTPLNASSTPKDSKYKHHGGFIGGGASQRAAHKIQVEAGAKGEIIKYAKWPANGFFGGRRLVFAAVLRRLAILVVPRSIQAPAIVHQGRGSLGREGVSATRPNNDQHRNCFSTARTMATTLPRLADGWSARPLLPSCSIRLRDSGEDRSQAKAEEYFRKIVAKESNSTGARLAIPH